MDNDKPKNIKDILTTPNPEYFSLEHEDQVIDIHTALRMDPNDGTDH